MSSLRARLIVAASLVLTAFVALCGAALEKAFRDSAAQAQRDKLQGLVYAILGAAEPIPTGDLTIATDKVPDPRLRQPQSGLGAALLNEQGQLVWRSPDFPRMPLAIKAPEVGQWKFERLAEPDRFAASFGMRWIDLEDDPHRYTVLVLEDAAAFDTQVGAFRKTLWAWLIGSALLLLLILIGVQRWGLSPLQELALELKQIEAGQQNRIQTEYPKELSSLAGALNAMITAERNQQTRYRNALGDLAHSLKTPLAVLRGISPEPHLQEQVGRIQHIVDYQLRRAAAVGSRTLSEPVALRPLAERITAALAKVYAGKGLRFEIHIATDQRVRTDQGDLYELLGNLLDNAAKYGRSRVRITVEAGRTRLRLRVEDDGPGFPDQPEILLERGVRADSHTPGQGIGLSAVAELVKAYEGRIELDRSQDLGGARVTVTL